MTYATDRLGDEPGVTERDIPIGDLLEDAVRTHGPARMFRRPRGPPELSS